MPTQRANLKGPSEMRLLSTLKAAPMCQCSEFLPLEPDILRLGVRFKELARPFQTSGPAAVPRNMYTRSCCNDSVPAFVQHSSTSQIYPQRSSEPRQAEVKEPSWLSGVTLRSSWCSCLAKATAAIKGPCAQIVLRVLLLLQAMPGRRLVSETAMQRSTHSHKKFWTDCRTVMAHRQENSQNSRKCSKCSSKQHRKKWLRAVIFANFPLSPGT